MTKIVQINPRGTLTLPKVFRDHFPGIDVMQVSIDDGGIRLEPLQLRDDFILEIERSSREAKKGKKSPLKEALERLDNHHGV